VDLTVLGSGTVAPSPRRTAPAHWVQAGEVQLLIDCGAGATHRLARYVPEWWHLTHVALSHFHVDHWGELPHLLFALRWGIDPPRTAPLTILGPEGLRVRITHLAAAYGDWITDPGFPLSVEELTPHEPRALSDDVTLDCCRTPHTDRSLALSLQDGTDRLVYTGDTGPSEHLGRWAAGCDLLLCECSLPDDQGVEIHLTPRQVGALARAVEPGQVVLTHFYPPVEGTGPARVVREQFDGIVVEAADGDRFTTGR